MIDDPDEGIAGMRDRDAFGDAGGAKVFAGLERLQQRFEQPLFARIDHQGNQLPQHPVPVG